MISFVNYSNAKNKLVRFHENTKALKMFKKTLLVAALAALSADAMAVDVSTSTEYTYGFEALNNGFLKNDFTAVRLNTVILELGAAYSVGDIIKINIAGATFKPGSTYRLNGSENKTIVGSKDGALTGTPPKLVPNDEKDDIDGSIDAAFLSATANQLVFRITGVKGITADQTLTLNTGSLIKLDSLAIGAKVTISATAETSTGTVFDVAGKKDSKVVGTVIQQHKFTVAANGKLDTKIDVADERKSLFETLSDTATITYNYTRPSFKPSNFGIARGDIDLKLTVRGSLTGFEKGATGATNLGVIKLAGTDAVVAADLQSGVADVKLSKKDNALAVLFTPDAAKATRVVLNAGAYTVDAAITDGTFTTTYTGLALGSFALNGANAQFAYVPINFVGAVTSQFEIGNKGVVDGDITLSGFDTAGNQYSQMLDFKAQAGKLTKIGDDDIAEAFGLTKGTKLNLTITVNAPATDITFGGYSNRGTTGRMSLQKL